MNNRGFSIIEMLVTLLIFSILLAAVFNAYQLQVRSTTREYKKAESEMEFGVARGIIENDLAMAGYGLADDYDFDGNGVQDRTPRAMSASTDAASDTLTLMGTGLGLASRQSQAWTYVASATPTFRSWDDSFWQEKREKLASGDHVIVMDPSEKRIQTQGGQWLFRYNGESANLTRVSDGTPLGSIGQGLLVYGLCNGCTADNPYYTVTYYLTNNGLPENCAPGSYNLIRWENRMTASTGGSRDAILSCVLDFQVSFGLDTDKNGNIDLNDDQGATAGGYTPKILNERLKMARVYMLVQSGNRDFQTVSPATILVGDSSRDEGRSITLTTDQRRYRWKLVRVEIAPRNVRK